MKECKIIRDLFPSYIDGLTNEDTNHYIEEHLNNCEECKTVLEDMKKDIKLDTTKKDSREVKYIKKYNKKMKILKIALLVILLIFMFRVTRNMIIIVSLDRKFNDYATSQNFYLKQILHSEDGTDIAEIYKKDNRNVRKYRTTSETINYVCTEYYNGQTTNTYYEIKYVDENISKKMAYLNKKDETMPVIPNSITTDNPIDFIITSLFSSITTENCNGKDCYRIAIKEPFTSSLIPTYYIEKETGLTIRSLGTGARLKNDGERDDFISDYQYEFDVVTDEDFIEPDISEYEIEE